MKRYHLSFGILGLIAFLLTGQYMHWVHNHLVGMNAGPRLLYRSAHIYILWASLMNFLLGLYFHRCRAKTAGLIQITGSLAILVCLPLILISFFVDSHNVDFHRTWARAGIYLALAGGLLHGFAALVDRRHLVKSGELR